jgi:hypothetical protein
MKAALIDNTGPIESYSSAWIMTFDDLSGEGAASIKNEHTGSCPWISAEAPQLRWGENGFMAIVDMQLAIIRVAEKI